MVDKEILADGGARVDVDARLLMGTFRHDPGDQRNIQFKELMRQTVGRNGLDGRISQKDLVRIVFHGQRELDLRIDTDAISALFSSKFYYFEVKDTSRVKFSAEDFKNDKSLKGEFIRGVISDTSLTDEQKDDIISLGLSALMGEELE